MKGNILTFILLCIVLTGYSQNRLKGRVTDASTGESLPGVNVMVKGSSAGAVTDADGRFILTAPTVDDVLSFSFVGYTTKEVVYKGQADINISLVSDLMEMDEVVVTALGIKREKKGLGYSMVEVKGDDVSKSNDGNILNSLKGKAAGVTVSSATGGATGSSEIVLRGYSTLGGTNGALIVVDGVPYSNRATGGGSFNDAMDFGSGISDLNPDEIESVSILKGANAAALYGSRALNGVVLITTKKGKKGKAVVTFSSSLKLSEVTNLPEFQNTYGQGNENNIGGFKYDGDQPYLEISKEKSWGAKMEGQMVRVDWLREKPLRSYTAQDDNVKDFFRMGTTFTNNLNISGGTEKSTYSFSVLSENLKDVIPTSEQDKYNMSLRLTHEVNSFMSVDGKMSFTHKKTHNRATIGSQRGSIFGLYIGPRSFHLSDIERYRYPLSGKTYSESTHNDNEVVAWSTSRRSSAGNPFWELHENPNDDIQSRLIGFGKLNFNLAKGLTLFTRLGWDYNVIEYTRLREKNSRYYAQRGWMNNSKSMNMEVNADFLLSYQTKIGDLNIQSNIGGNHRYSRNSNTFASGDGFTVIDFNSFENLENKYVSENEVEHAVNSFYGSAQFSYKNFAFLDITGRNDWTSSLSEDNRSFFYPSVNFGLVITDALNIKNDILGYAKIRASYAEVGNDIGPYAINSYYNFGNDIMGRPSGSVSNKIENTDLKPERSKSYELGADLRFFKNRLGIDFTWYDARIEDQIIGGFPIAQSSGYTNMPVNAGEISNKGIELSVSGTPIKTKDWKWDLTINYSRNNNEVVKFNEDIEKIRLGDARNADVYAMKGETFGTIYGKGYKRNEDGVVVVDSDGIPITDSEEKILGDIQPDFIGSIHSSLSYKGITLGVLIDGSFGGEVISLSQQDMNRAGTSKQSLDGREGWIAAVANGDAQNSDRSNAVGGLDYWVGNSVFEDGTPNSGASARYANPYQYWHTMRGKRNGEAFINDVTYVKLREVSLSYSLPKNIMSRLPLTDISFGVVGRNLLLLNYETDFFDPEAYKNNNSTGGLGIESGTWPTQRSVTFNVRVKF